MLIVTKPMKKRKNVSVSLAQGRSLKCVTNKMDTNHRTTTHRRMKRIIKTYNVEKINRTQRVRDSKPMNIENLYNKPDIIFKADRLNRSYTGSGKKKDKLSHTYTA